MRLDKYLKVSRLIKRRTVAKELCDKDKVYVNDKLANPSYIVKIGDKIKIVIGTKEIIVRVLKITESIRKEDASLMYELLEENKIKEIN